MDLSYQNIDERINRSVKNDSARFKALHSLTDVSWKLLDLRYRRLSDDEHRDAMDSLIADIQAVKELLHSLDI